MTKELKPISAIDLKWTKISAKYLEVFPAEQHINLDYSIIRKIKVGPVDLH